MKTSFRNEINKLRKQHKISISKLAKLADVDYGTIWKFLGGTAQRTNIKSNNLEKIYDAFRTLEKRKPKEKWKMPLENFNNKTK